VYPILFAGTVILRLLQVSCMLCLQTAGTKEVKTEEDSAMNDEDSDGSSIEQEPKQDIVSHYIISDLVF